MRLFCLWERCNAKWESYNQPAVLFLKFDKSFVSAPIKMENFPENRDHDLHPGTGLMMDESTDSFAIFTGAEDLNFEFSYEDFERVTGKTYQDYLRIHDDMI